MASAKDKKPTSNKNQQSQQPDVAMQRDLEADKKRTCKRSQGAS